MSPATRLVVDPNYTLRLTGDWTDLPPSHPDSRCFWSEEQQVQLIVSCLPMNITSERTEYMARRLAQVRLEAENASGREFNYRATITEPILAQQPWGHAVAYYGSDTSGRQFTYSGAVTPFHVLGVYADSHRLSKHELRALMQAVLLGLTASEP